MAVEEIIGMPEVKRNQKENRRVGTNRRTAVHQSISKGQMFIIASILALVAMVTLKNLLGIYATFEEKRFSEAFTLDKDLNNLKSEYRYLVGLASLRGDANQSGISNMYNFSNFTTSDMDAKVLYAYVFGNGSTQRYSITVGNFINDEINITLNATNATPRGYAFTLNSRQNTTQEFNSSINGTVNITLRYTQPSENITEQFPVQISTSNIVAGFFDITVFSASQFVRSKSIYNRTW